jgi:hypothetical protein
MTQSHAAHFAQMSDEELNECKTFYGDDSTEQWAAWKAEKDKRRKIKEQLAQEQQATEKRRKDSLLFSEAIATEICERISAGELLTVICLDQHMPTVRRCNQWLRMHSDFKALYEQSLQDRLFIFEEQLIQIPDEAARQYNIETKGNNTKSVLDPAKITAAKLRVEVRRLHLKAMRPEKWGETSTLITKTADPDDPSQLSQEELERRIAEIEHKDRTLKAAKVA